MQRSIVQGRLSNDCPATPSGSIVRSGRSSRRIRAAGAGPLQAVQDVSSTAHFSLPELPNLNDLGSTDVLGQLQKLNSDSFWQSLPPHFGVKLVTDRLGTISLPEVQIETPEAIKALSTGSFESLYNGATSLVPLSQVVDQMGQSISQRNQAVFAGLSKIFDGVPELSMLQGMQFEPHFGRTYAIKAADGLAAWLQSQVCSVRDGMDPAAISSLKAAVASLQQTSQSLQQLASKGPAADVAESMRSTLELTRPFFQKVAAGVPHPEALADMAAAVLTRVQTMGWGGLEPATLALVVAGVLSAVAISTPQDGYEGPASGAVPSLTPDYSPEVLDEVFSRRPVAVSRRAAQVAAAAAQFGGALLMDIWTNRLKANEPQRARQLRSIIEELGPAYVKVAQALSTRVDLLTPEYFTQIQMLQDRVPPFPCSEAYAALEASLGRPRGQVFQTISDRPIAAASLGQVYRGKLREEYGGEDVAIKVLRPGVLDQVGLDLYVIRKLFSYLQTMPEVSNDWVGIIDSWAFRFFQEMDYAREAQNAITFQEQMRELPGILVPQPNLELSSSNILITTWVEGEKLSESSASDVRELCNTMLNCYLIQLLDTGFLHADPHPGNLIRTPDGKICILDYGLMTEVTEAQRLALVEYIAHLISEDWENVTIDLRTMGFIPESITDVRAAGLVEPIGAIMSQLVGGGGAAKVNIDKVMVEIEDLGKRYPISVPSFFALILRAFSVIEGIALGVDPDYAIVRECFPYLSRRLLADPHPRSKKALRDVLYGRRQRLDMVRLARLTDAFGAFTVDGLAAQQPMRPKGQLIDPTTKEALRAVLSPRGSYVAELLVEEMVAATDALSRDALGEVMRRVLGSPPAAATLSALDRLGPLRPLLLPVPTPLEVMSRLAPAVALNQEDEEALDVVRGVFDLVQRLPAPVAPSGEDFQRFFSAGDELLPLAQELAPGVFNIGQLFVRRFVQRIVQRIADEVGRTPDYAVDMAALGFMPTSSPSSSRFGVPTPGAGPSARPFSTPPQGFPAPGAGPSAGPFGAPSTSPQGGVNGMNSLAAAAAFPAAMLPAAAAVELVRGASTLVTAALLAPVVLWGIAQQPGKVTRQANRRP